MRASVRRIVAALAALAPAFLPTGATAQSGGVLQPGAGVVRVPDLSRLLDPSLVNVTALCAIRPDICQAAPTMVCPAHSAPPPGIPPAPAGSHVAYQQFPPGGPLETAWFVTFDWAVHRGFFITSAYFKPSAAKPWIKILATAGLSEIFVPYQSGQPRYLDLSTPIFTFPLVTATAADTGPCGRVVGRDNKVVREVVDKGVLWKNDDKVYRGHKMVLWATLDAANYNYIISYAFHDDGRIEFRIAGTAENLPSAPFEAHIHNAIWRVDIDLNGPGANSVFVNRHLETTSAPASQNVHEPFNGNKEGALNFNAPEFTTLHVMDATLKNSRGSPSGYMVMPMVMGVSRHQEPFMRNDFWVTRYRPGELTFTDIQNHANGESIDNTDIVIWHVTPVLHLPRDEDGEKVGNFWHGSALAMWTGFDMKPHNLFDRTPFYPPLPP